MIGLLFGSGVAWADETYTVKRGDTLSHIAAHYDLSWPALYEQNRQVVGSNPNLIFPGQVLTVEDGPKASSQSSAPKPRTGSADVAPRAGTARPATGAITSRYGMRTHPITGKYKLHTGTDFGYGDGNAYVARSGEVTGVEWNDAYGNLVTISHGGGVTTRYAHLASVWVESGEQVGAGDVVGAIGSTGWSTGAHLHFEVLIDGDFVNPEHWLG